MGNEIDKVKKYMIEVEGEKIFDKIYSKDFRNRNEEENFAKVQLQNASEDARNDYDFMSRFLKESRIDAGDIFELAGEELRNNKEFALICISKSMGRAFKYIGENLKIDKDFIIEAVKREPNIYPKLSEELRNDKEIAFAVSQVWSHAMQYVGKSLKGDMDIIKASIRTNDDLPEIVDKNVMQYVDEELKVSPEFKKEIEEFQEQLKEERHFIYEKLKQGLSMEEATKQWKQQLSASKENIKSEKPNFEINEYGEIIRPNNIKTPLQQKEEELYSLEEEEKKISETEALIKKEMDKKGKGIGE